MQHIYDLGNVNVCIEISKVGDEKHMNVIDELENYCDINNPVGALLLSGEWGCGKTYLLNNKFIPKVEDKYAFVCVSLFGIDNLNDLRAEVKRKWLEKATELNNNDDKSEKNKINLSKLMESYNKIYDKIKDNLPEKLKEKGKIVSSLMDLIDFMSIKNKIGDKKFILVFDDLERSGISNIDLLGCINDYCENQRFNTIIIANENKMKRGKGDELSYREIKEKIVQRVIRFVPDYDDIVSNAIETMSCGILYKGMLRNNKEVLSKILSGDFNDELIIQQYEAKNSKYGSDSQKELRDLLKQRPHNIRSFKCALQDFERVYDKLIEAGIQDCYKQLHSFTCFMMTNKAGLVEESSTYGNLFLYDNVKKLYPEVFDEEFILNGVLRWIVYGEWNDEIITREMQLFLKKENAVTPLEILKTHDLYSIDEEIIDNGIKELLEEAYAGNLSLNEYVHFIRNCYYAREYEVDMPIVDWEKIKTGIKKQIKIKIEANEEESHVYNVIWESNKKYYEADEWSTYQIIKDFRDNNVLTNEKNQKVYIDLISSDLQDAFRKLSNRRYNRFSLEMELATIEAFKNANNSDKSHFPTWFIGIWQFYSESVENDVKITEASLEKLRKDLGLIMQEYKEKGKNISARHTQFFIEKLDKFMIPEVNEYDASMTRV